MNGSYKNRLALFEKKLLTLLTLHIGIIKSKITKYNRLRKLLGFFRRMILKQVATAKL